MHDYHYTWLNERAVEVALALDLLERHPGASVLEVGNVLGHYVPFEHTVVDKYEQAPGVLNEDVADLDLGRRSTSCWRSRRWSTWASTRTCATTTSRCGRSSACARTSPRADGSG